MYNDNFYKLLFEASWYDYLSKYYKYWNVQNSLYFSKSHQECINKLVQLSTQNRSELNSNSTNSTNSTLPMVRVFHASPDAPAVDIYINNQPVFKNVSYKMLSNYLKVPAGDYRIEVYPAGTKENALINNIYRLSSGNVFTIAAINELKKLSLLAIPDQIIVPTNEAAVKFVHLSPDGPPVDVAVVGGDVIFSNVSFSQITNVLNLSSINLDLEVRLAGTKTKVLEIKNVYFEPNTSYTIYAVGFTKDEPQIEALIFKNK
ncbi:MAG: hypothetical protein K0S34_226 [Bacillales bacterium]|jgi:hypothetical protein|nr:hypothetical protein [Bacillales bacterium]